MNDDLVKVLVWGDYACMTRPELKVERVSYPILTPSSARGILEAIFWEPQMYYMLHEVAVVRRRSPDGTEYGRGTWVSLRRNEVQSVISVPGIKSWMKGAKPVSYIEAGGGAADGTQRNTLALRNVAYLITAEVRLTEKAEPPRDNLAKYIDRIRTRASRGKCYHRPCLGCREFDAYFEWVDDASAINIDDWTDELGLMLYDVFDPIGRSTGRGSKPESVFFDAKVKKGRMACHPDQVKMFRAKREEGRPC